MSKNLKISVALVVAALIAVLAIANAGGDDSTAAPADDPSDRVVRPDSQRLSTAEDGKVTFVEFLDFECEACAAAYPAIEELRDDYDGRVTFVVRNFPLHNNSEAAARAAEAAAEQGKFEQMYDMLFQTQTEWGEKDTSQEDVFFGYAELLGLDMEQFRTVYDDPATLAKIRRDKADGTELGVEGTPTFFLNGDMVEVSSLAELIELIDAALAA
ncbi:MAG: DsbA family protein [Acidimicrobiia bacterium]